MSFEFAVMCFDVIYANPTTTTTTTTTTIIIIVIIVISKIHADFMLRNAAVKDVEEYKKQQIQRRRQSVAMRLDSWRHEKMGMCCAVMCCIVT
jgi:uncharacterized membrane protein